MAEECIAPSKTCSKCLVPKPATSEFFGRERRVRSGFKAACRDCHYADNKPRMKPYRERNLDKFAEYGRRQRLRPEVRERDRLRAQRLRDENPEAGKAKVRAWRERDPVRAREVCAAKERRRRAIIRGASGNHTAADVAALRAKQSSCFYCDSAGQPLQVDHFVPLARGGSNAVENLVLACGYCNASKNARMPWEWRPERFKSQEVKV